MAIVIIQTLTLPPPARRRRISPVQPAKTTRRIAEAIRPKDH
jgi:hypothetical protein